MQAIFKVIILLSGLGAFVTGQALLGAALLALGIAVIIAVRPAEKASEPATDTATEDTSATTQAVAVGYTALLLVLAAAALAFIINGVMPGGSGLLR